MKKIRGFLVLFWGILFLVAAVRAGEKHWVFDFETDELGKTPAGFYPAQTGGRGELAPWLVVPCADAPSGKRVVLVKPNPRTNRGSTFNVLIQRDISLKDLTLSVYVKAVRGREDQGGGLIWRAKDPDNYYVVRWNPLEDNFRLYYVKNGQRHLLKSSSFMADPAKWHHLKVIHRGDLIECYFDGKLRLRTKDRTFRKAGHIGLWTKADASTAFDLLQVEALP